MALFAAALYTAPLSAQQAPAGDFTNDSISGRAAPSPAQPGAKAPERAVPDNQAGPDRSQQQNAKAKQKPSEARAVSAEHRRRRKATADNPASQDSAAEMSASLLDESRKGREGAATVLVHTTGVKMTDPDGANEQPKPGEAHLHYRVDDGPVIASTSLKLELHDLKPGTHTITVMLAGNDHRPLRPERTLTVTIPSGATARR